MFFGTFWQVYNRHTHTSSLFHPFLLKITLRFSLYNNAGGAGNPKKKHIGLTKKNFDFQEAEFQLRRSNPLAFSAKQQLCPFCFIIVTCLTGSNSRPCSISKKIVDMQLHKSWSVLILLLLLTPTYFSLHFISSPHVQFLFF